MKNHQAKYAFYYALSLISLLFLAVSLALILFQIINLKIVDSLNEYSFNNGQISLSFSASVLRFGISALIISGPVFFGTVALINKGLIKGEIKTSSALRNWLSYFILAVSAWTALGSLIGILNTYLSGEASWKSFLKILIITLLAVLVFSYYLYDIRRQEILKNDKKIKTFFIISLTLVILVFISAWFFVESPQKARAKKIDTKVMRNIYNLETYINRYYEENKKLPEDLGDLNDLLIGASLDYSLGLGEEKIEYQKIDEQHFNLCANFKSDGPSASMKIDYLPNYDDYRYYQRQNYSQGWNCFSGNLWLIRELEIETNFD